MIKIINDKNISRLISTDQRDKKLIINNEDIVLSAHEVLKYNTGITIQCTEENEEVFIKGGFDEVCYFDTERFDSSKASEPQELILYIINTSSKKYKISKDTEYARIYTSIKIKPEDRDYYSKIIYDDNGLIVKKNIDVEVDKVSLSVDQEGNKKYLTIYFKE